MPYGKNDDDMKVKTKLYISVIASIGMAILTGVVLFISMQQTDEAEEENRIAVAIAKGVSELRSITFDYFLQHGERSRIQWQSKYDSITRLITEKEFKTPEAQIILQNMDRNLKGIKPLFFEFIEIYEKGGGVIELRERLSSQIILRTQAMLSDAYRLSEAVRKEMIATQRVGNILVIFTIGIFVVITIATLYVFNRSIAKPLIRLHEGTEIIGRGNLDYKVWTGTKDEIGQFSSVFDRMVENLKAVMASRDELNREIEERKQAEERYRTVIQIAMDGFWLVDNHGHIIDVNDAACSMIGYTRDELLNMSIPDIEAKESLEDTARHIRKVMEAGSDRFETRHRCKDGRIIDIESSTIYRDINGGQFIAFLRDITDRKLAMEKIIRYSEDLSRSNEELQQFAYIASHDLQEPLRMVASYVKLIERRYKGRLDKDADEFIEFAVDGANRMKEMIEGLLEYSRVKTYGKPLVPTDCEGILSDALNNLQMTIKENNAVVTHDPLPDVLADDVQIGRVFQNLISNAIKFRKKEEPPRIHISAQQEGREWVFSFRDNGIGIKPQYKDGLFTMFKRVYSRKEYPGTGIGLAVCRRIVERHGGRIWVESEYGSGSAFYFTTKEV
ncbi:MAG: PAS domain S-box protein [Nitrospinae bacterium]|nr:PAS domain S-box protein [Nitrospinota bacterium]